MKLSSLPPLSDAKRLIAAYLKAQDPVFPAGYPSASDMSHEELGEVLLSRHEAGVENPCLDWPCNLYDDFSALYLEGNTWLAPERTDLVSSRRYCQRSQLRAAINWPPGDSYPEQLAGDRRTLTLLGETPMPKFTEGDGCPVPVLIAGEYEIRVSQISEHEIRVWITGTDLLRSFQIGQQSRVNRQRCRTWVVDWAADIG